MNVWPLDGVATGSVRNEERTPAIPKGIATPEFTLSGTEVDAETTTSHLLGPSLNEADGIKGNADQDCHAIEFLSRSQVFHGAGSVAAAPPGLTWQRLLRAGWTGGYTK